jgi:hypothetical protein
MPRIAANAKVHVLIYSSLSGRDFLAFRMCPFMYPT